MKKLKYPSTQIARERFGPESSEYKRIKALETWAIAHGYDGYRAINRLTKKEKAQQTSLL